MTEPITWTTERRKLSELTPWPRNPRQIKRAEAERLAESFDTFGQVETLAVGPANEVYNGHQRLAVLLDDCGPDYEVDVRVSSRALTEKEREKLTVYLHKGAAGEWDWDALANEFEFDDLIEWGFSEKELTGLDFGGDEPAEDPGAQVDRAEELREKWGVETGQLWQLGEHRLLCGDSTKAEDVARVMGGEKAGAVVTDPPYGQDQVDVPHDSPEEHEALLAGCVNNLPVDNGIVIAFQSPRLFMDWMRAISDHQFKRALWLYKEAQQETFPWHGWIMKSEMILISEIGKGEWLDVHPYAHDCYKVAEVSFKTEKIAAVRTHGSIKPITVVRDLVSRVGGIVYEPFCGSGTTLIACEQLGRVCRAIEIDPGYVACTLDRFFVMTGGEPQLLHT
jgi:hypothetical protein